MKTRLYWYDSNLSQSSIRSAADYMLNNPYSKKRPLGFLVHGVRKTVLNATFVERIEWKESIEDPVSGTVEIERVEVRTLNFRLCSTRPCIQVMNPPRSLNSFFNVLATDVLQENYIEDIAVDPMKWVEAIESRYDELCVQNLVTMPFGVSDASTAQLTLSGTEDVRKELVHLTGDRDAKVSRLTFRTNDRRHSFRCEITRGGIARYSGDSTSFASALRESLSSAWSRR